MSSRLFLPQEGSVQLWDHSCEVVVLVRRDKSAQGSMVGMSVVWQGLACGPLASCLKGKFFRLGFQFDTSGLVSISLFLYSSSGVPGPGLIGLRRVSQV